ncbi:DUF6339 family protein [Cellulomonas marina]|uniref:Uncharacterized protein n=1 Tax=Cellulomonas marina TaxID=988821 RepID=A0A1I0Y7M6_9CELL|nr:DUF6339 family protein [Cellulomonas marina]GIG29820.1 hypothetical protein Cma02nite_24200 [Cellulomonas marina]SFB08776.1 hypothetical protein SAMN05421867_106203 [Cellulomonas marina]
MSDAVLHSFVRVPDIQDRERVLEAPDFVGDLLEPVRRADGSTIPMSPFDSLMSEWRRRFAEADAIEESDRWLAPRLHAALRLLRVEAADKGIWLWLALRYSDYLAIRWGSKGDVNESRWTGSVNKQAFARLWWGAELFRDGGDYRPVVGAFVRQDFVNSFLQRDVARVRPLALELSRATVNLDEAARPGSPMSADQINDLAGVANLSLAGVAPEALFIDWSEDVVALETWVRKASGDVWDGDELPQGPTVAHVPAHVRAAASEVVGQFLRDAPEFAVFKQNRSGLRTVRRRAEPAERMS